MALRRALVVVNPAAGQHNPAEMYALGIPTGQGEVLETVFSGKPLRLDVGYLPGENRSFALAAGAGYDARLISAASHELKNALGFGACIVPGIKNLFTPRPPQIEQETVRPLQKAARRTQLRRHSP